MKKYLFIALAAAFFVGVVSISTVHAEKADKDKGESGSSREDKAQQPDHVIPAETRDEHTQDIDKEQAADIARAENALLRLEAAEARAEHQDLHPDPTPDAAPETSPSFGGITEDNISTLANQVNELKDAIESADTPEELQTQSDALTALIAPQE